MSHTALSINLNKIALLRNSRTGNYPNPEEFAKLCIDSGCQGITLHPRPNQRDIRPDDVEKLGRLCKSIQHIEFNIEGNPFAGEQGSYPGFMRLVEQQRPDQVTLVPDEDNQLTSDHGFNLQIDAERIQPIIRQLHAWGLRVSLFMDADIEQIKLAQQVGADRVELYTGPYAAVFSHRQSSDFEAVHHRYLEAANTAREIGLGVNAGHDLNLQNLAKFLEIPDILEVSIGHAFITDSLLMGMGECTKAYLNTIKTACTD